MRLPGAVGVATSSAVVASLTDDGRKFRNRLLERVEPHPFINGFVASCDNLGGSKRKMWDRLLLMVGVK